MFTPTVGPYAGVMATPAGVPTTVLVVDDEPMVREVVARYLELDGALVHEVSDGPSAVEWLGSHRPDLVVLDVMLPGLDGLSILRRLRADGEIPVILLTARAEEVDRVLGLELGADDYVVKPFVVREVVLRVTALANRLAERRARPSSSDPGGVLKVGPIELDPVTHEVRISGVPTQLRPLEYKLLQLLVSDPGRVFSREELLEQVWELRGDINTRTVDVHVRRLRVSLGPAADVVETVHGFGYRARRDA